MIRNFFVSTVYFKEHPDKVSPKPALITLNYEFKNHLKAWPKIYILTARSCSFTDVPNYLPTSMQLSPSCEASSFSYRQEIPCIL
jgi:hypothetical protein